MERERDLGPDALSALSRLPGVHVTSDRAVSAANQVDFGHLCEGTVHAVVRPANVPGLCSLVSWAAEHGVGLTPRSKGLSQSGQSVPAAGCSVEMDGFRDVVVSAAERTVRCGAGATFREVFAETSKLGLTPEVMPLNLDLSVGGVLSAGGYGSTSHRFGLVVATVETCDVVTGTGEHVTASRGARSEVFDAVLGGAGHFGLITGAVLRMRPMGPQVRTFTLLYDGLDACLRDQKYLRDQPWAHHMEGFCSAAILGLRRAPRGGRRIPFARWFCGIQVTVEHEPGGEPAATLLDGLNHRELVLADDDDTTAFAARYDARFEAMRVTGAWQLAHPWVEALVPLEAALDIVPKLLARLPMFLGDGHRLSILADVPGPGLLMLPAGRPVVAFAILPMGVPGPLSAPALAALRDAHDALLDVGAKRYLSGWLFEPNKAAWQRHFGPQFDAWRARKRELDPAGVFSSRLLPGGVLD